MLLVFDVVCLGFICVLFLSIFTFKMYLYAVFLTGLSKWVRAKVNHHIQSRDAIESLSEFAQARLLKPCPEIR